MNFILLEGVSNNEDTYNTNLITIYATVATLRIDVDFIIPLLVRLVC